MYIHEVSRNKYIFLVIYIDDILFVTSNVDILFETKKIILAYHDMKNPSEALLVLNMQIHHDEANDIFRLSQRVYIDRILKRLTYNLVLLKRLQL